MSLGAASMCVVNEQRPFQYSLAAIFRWTALAGLGLVILIYLASTKGGRTFFSPDTLESREQGERLSYFFLLPVSRSNFKVYRPKLASYLIAEGYWSAKSTNTPRWLLVEHWNSQWRDGDTMLSRIFGRTSYWIDWSEQHPDLAAVVWPRVLESLRQSNLELSYDEPSAILDIAKAAKSPEDFERRFAKDPLLAELRGFYR